VAQIEQRQPDGVIGVFPSDHFIGNESAFATAVETAFAHAEGSDGIVTIGIDPTEPNTGFGYLELGEETGLGVTRLLRFVEKPDQARAEEFLRSGRFVWNGGMFVFRSSYFRAVLASSSPEIGRLADEFVDAPAERRANIYASMPSISIDFAVMEKAPQLFTVRGNFDWSDVGTWSAVARRTNSFAAGRVIEADNASFFHSSRGTPVILAGTKGLIIVETDHGLLVMNENQSEVLSTLVKSLDDRSKG
jgi:mannose-1-phosphate guanylyltransferase